MGLEDYIEKVLRRNPKLRAAVKHDKRLRSTLHDVVAESYDNYRSLLGWSTFTDKINRILGPLEAGLRYFSPLGSTGFGVYSAAKLLHYGLIKLPYALYYTLKTGDVKGALGIGLGEVAKYVLPFGTLGDALPLYRKTVERYILRNSEKKLEDYLAGNAANIDVPAALEGYNPQVADGVLSLDAPSEGYELRTTAEGEGKQLVYLRRRQGTHPNILTRMQVALPPGTRRLKMHRKGLIKTA